MKLVLSVSAIAVSIGAAHAQFSIVNPGPINSNGPFNSSVNGVLTFNYAGPAFRVGGINFSGDVRRVNSGSFLSETRWRIFDPSGNSLDSGSLSSVTGWTDTRTITASRTPTLPFGSAASSVGDWSVRFYETFDDGGTASVDAEWTNLSFEFTRFTPPTPPPVIEDLGNLNSTGVVSRSGSLAAGQIAWYSFSLTSPASFFDIWTFGTQFGTSVDTELALFDAEGVLLAQNDDVLSGQGPENFWSRLGFGTGSGIDPDGPLGDVGSFGATSPGTATSTPLGPGTYYVALGGFNSTFASGFSAASTSSLTGSYRLNLIPAPGAAGLAGLATLFVLRRRRTLGGR
ncbi:MAG: DVUA0089 family protein [Planctomycetota bacterium]|nr:DVUA0089 family protein [Planctomycetota bacterium]